MDTMIGSALIALDEHLYHALPHHSHIAGTFGWHIAHDNVYVTDALRDDAPVLAVVPLVYEGDDWDAAMIGWVAAPVKAYGNERIFFYHLLMTRISEFASEYRLTPTPAA